MKNIIINNYTPIQLKLPVDHEKIIEITDPVYIFIDVVNHIDLKRYFVEKDYRTGRHGYDHETLLKVILFAFMENGYTSLREIEKLCKTDIRFMWILDEMKAPSYATLCNILNHELNCEIEEILADINEYIFEAENVNLNHVYIDGMISDANERVYPKICVNL